MAQAGAVQDKRLPQLARCRESGIAQEETGAGLAEAVGAEPGWKRRETVTLLLS